MNDLADYLGWQRYAAEHAAMTAEIAQLRADNAALQAERKQLQAERKQLRHTIRKQSSLLSDFRRRYNIEPRRHVRRDIFTLIEQGLRNCEIVSKGFNKITVEKCRREYRDATSPK